MAHNTDRIERIIKRAIDYNNGLLTSEAFTILEEMDNENEEALHISFMKRNKIIQAIREILDQDDDVSINPEPEPKEPVFSMTLDEYEALSLYDKSKVYNEHPDEIEALYTNKPPKKLNKEMFNALPLTEQSKIYQEQPEEVKALIDGRVSYIDCEG